MCQGCEALGMVHVLHIQVWRGLIRELMTVAGEMLMHVFPSSWNLSKNLHTCLVYVLMDHSDAVHHLKRYRVGLVVGRSSKNLRVYCNVLLWKNFISVG